MAAELAREASNQRLLPQQGESPLIPREASSEQAELLSTSPAPSSKTAGFDGALQMVAAGPVLALLVGEPPPGPSVEPPQPIWKAKVIPSPALNAEQSRMLSGYPDTRASRGRNRRAGSAAGVGSARLHFASLFTGGKSLRKIPGEAPR
jgi:hypothetical protein